MRLIDTHCHVHEADYPIEAKEVQAKSLEKNVDTIICVGTSVRSSREAVSYALAHKHAHCAVGIHPHDSYESTAGINWILKEMQPRNKIVAIGETGLDYYYENSPRAMQMKRFEEQLQLARDYGLPVIFHVRDAFDDFWPIVDNFSGIRGVLHSFTDTMKNAEIGLGRGFLIGMNGISVFTKDPKQIEMYDQLPLESIVFETDAPFLTPPPHRGKVNMPSMIYDIAQYHAERRGLSVEEISHATTSNAQRLFGV